MTSKPQINVSLKLTGDNVSPDDITQIVKLSPTRTWRAGDAVQGTQLRREQDGWALVLPYRDTYDMEVLIEELLELLGPCEHNIVDAARQLGLKAEISFGVYIKHETPTCFFKAATMKRVIDLGADLDIDLILTE
jgi:hypothetical protein